MQCLGSFLLLRLRGFPSTGQRVHWLHRCCQLVLRRLGFELSVIGSPAKEGLLISNHLSYLDILFYGATLPCVFVAKSEVRRWPVMGWLAALGGTLFIDRGSPASATESAAQIQRLLAIGIVVLVFPEGTSSDGSSVLRFYPSLFEPAVRTGLPVTSAAIGYSAGRYVEEKDLCYYGDLSFAPHLFQILQLEGIRATLRFAHRSNPYANRKQAATDTQLEVVSLRKLLRPEAASDAD